MHDSYGVAAPSGVSVDAVVSKPGVSTGACCCMQAVLAVSLCALPKEFSGIFTEEKDRVVKNWHLFFCVCTGLWGGLIIGLVTEYYTSNAFQPVKVGSLSSVPACKKGCFKLRARHPGVDVMVVSVPE